MVRKRFLSSLLALLLMPYYGVLANSYSLSFNQKGCIEIKKNSLNNFTKQFALESWIYPTSFNAFNFIISSNMNGTGYTLLLTDGYVQFEANCLRKKVARSNNRIELNKWTHLAATWDGEFLILYINGEEASKVYENRAPISNNENVYIGGSVFTNDTFFTGSIDEVRLWNRGLTQYEIKRNRFIELKGDESNLVGYYRFDDDTNVTLDYSNSGNNGKLSGKINISTNIVELSKYIEKDFLAEPTMHAPGSLTSFNNYSNSRLALLIGNSAYGTGALENPVNDVRAMRSALEELSFEVVTYENCSLSNMKRAIDEFGAALKKYDVGLFYYAGHGIQIDGINYLIPVDADIRSKNDVEYNCVMAGRVLGKMEDANTKINIVILDACRNNPFARSWSRGAPERGLAVMEAPIGSVIAYATSPGKTAADGTRKNGLYTEALLKYINTPNIPIINLFQKVRNTVIEGSAGIQIPWESTSLPEFDSCSVKKIGIKPY